MVSFSNVLMARRPALAILLLQIAFSVGEECLTTGERPKRCVFPFTYQKVTYNGCTNATDKDGKLWCATKVNESGHYILYSEHYGHCQSSCPEHIASNEIGLRQATSDEDDCPDNQECVEQKKCEEFQDEKKGLAVLSSSSDEYRNLLKSLQKKICNRASQKVCCSCPCQTRDQCSYVNDLYQAKDITRLKSLICNKRERKFYCCENPPTKKESVVNVIPGDPLTDPSWLPDPEKQECGFNESPPSRVKGGEDTQPGEYPFTALVGSTDSLGKVQWKCGGTLINHWYVVTAAHCHGTNNKRISIVRMGEWSVKEDRDCWQGGQGGQDEWCLDPAQDFDIGPNDVTVHEDYQPRDKFENDIALVKLNRAATMRLGVSMVCLPSDTQLAARHLNVANLETDSGLTGKYGIVVGWGYTEYDPYKGGVQGDINKYAVAQNLQQKLEIPVMSPDECNSKFRGRFTPADTQICAGGEDGKDSCKGDSGGPLYFKTIAGRGNRPSDDNLTPIYLLGIVSFGSKFCGNGTPGVYTSVKDFVPWIEKIIRKNY